MIVTNESQVGAAIRHQRLARGLDQRDLAELAGVSTSALRRLEAGQGSTLRTTLAVLRVLDTPVTLPGVESEPPHGRRRVSGKTHVRPTLERREEKVSLEMHRAVARRLRADGPGVRARAKANLETVSRTVHGPQAQEWVREWSDALAGPTGELVDLLVRQDEHGIDMRQVSPFAGVLTEDERAAAIRKARRW
ncbi:helix-turn-helix domain-containing protein [Cellulomonas soli]|uniref:helix-turn-helix domain-containing protein n=1 Tax=Cellulomonas soli TaxID=931535 RepID=UPI003F83F7DA